MMSWAWLMRRLREWLIKIEARFCHTEHPPGMLQCRQVVELIIGYLEGTLDPDERRAFEAHIADCQNCWRFLQTYRKTVALGQQLRKEAIPPDVRERLETFLRHRLPRSS